MPVRTIDISTRKWFLFTNKFEKFDVVKTSGEKGKDRRVNNSDLAYLIGDAKFNKLTELRELTLAEKGIDLKPTIEELGKKIWGADSFKMLDDGNFKIHIKLSTFRSVHIPNLIEMPHADLVELGGGSAGPLGSSGTTTDSSNVHPDHYTLDPNFHWMIGPFVTSYTDAPRPKPVDRELEKMSINFNKVFLTYLKKGVGRDCDCDVDIYPAADGTERLILEIKCDCELPRDHLQLFLAQANIKFDKDFTWVIESCGPNCYKVTITPGDK
ncbi:hypothetical protein ACFL5G_02745 [Candidatus Margulisiibacteriota bacterium]